MTLHFLPPNKSQIGTVKTFSVLRWSRWAAIYGLAFTKSFSCVHALFTNKVCLKHFFHFFSVHFESETTIKKTFPLFHFFLSSNDRIFHIIVREAKFSYNSFH